MDRRMLNPGNYVIVDDLKGHLSRFVIDDTTVYIHPENNVNIPNAITLINGEWKVKGAEHINYKITFESSSPSAALSTSASPQELSPVSSIPPSFSSSPPTVLAGLTGNEVFVVNGYTETDEIYPEPYIRVAGNLESALILAYDHLAVEGYYMAENYYNKDWSKGDINIEDRRDLYDEFVKYMVEDNLDSLYLRNDSYNNVFIRPLEVETPSQTLIKSARFR